MAEHAVKTPLLSNAAYDVLNKLVKYILPALGTAYFSLASIWNFPAAEQVVGTIAVLTTLFGILLAVSKSSYNSADITEDTPLQQFDGAIVFNHSTNPLSETMSIELEEGLAGKSQVTLRVKTQE